MEQMLEQAVRHLAAIERPSASEGEHEAAEWIAQRLREEGCRDVAIDEERAHGTYWWPLGLLSAIGGIAGVLGRRRPRLARVLAVAAAAGIADDISGGKLWFRRRFLPHGSTWNVVAEAGDPAGVRTVVFVAHHDAAHWSLLFHPGVAPWIAQRFPEQYEKVDTTAPVMFPVFGGPLLVALGTFLRGGRLRRLGSVVSFGSALTFAEIGSRSTVPGANDNLTGVATILGLARTLREQPIKGVRVVLVSTGSEESFMEGMHGFVARHLRAMPSTTTDVVCVDTVGSPELVQCEGEGMLKIGEYDRGLKDAMSAAALDAGEPLRRGLWFRNATDGLIAMRAGYRTTMLGSVGRYKLPSNYHWPTDTADNVDYSTVARAMRVCDALVRRLAGSPQS